MREACLNNPFITAQIASDVSYVTAFLVNFRKARWAFLNLSKLIKTFICSQKFNRL